MSKVCPYCHCPYGEETNTHPEWMRCYRCKNYYMKALSPALVPITYNIENQDFCHEYGLTPRTKEQLDEYDRKATEQDKCHITPHKRPCRDAG